MYSKILIANRGEIALRIIRTLREMGITSVAVYSDADRTAPHVLEADEAYRIGPPPVAQSYLDYAVLLETATSAGCQAIHPGYGFLAENAEFADAVAGAGLAFIGPSPAAIRLMGDKLAARQAAIDAKVPVVPGTAGPVISVDDAREFLDAHGLPVLVKAGGGGGGRGIRIVEDEGMLAESIARASREALTFFGNPDVYLERYFRGARHIEVQVVGDQQGLVQAWGERDCSTQRRRQKLIEETPAPNLPGSDRVAILEAAVRLATKASYVGAGTVEFLYTGQGQFFFLEMNTRIQVEHPVTEAVTGLDLIRAGIEVCAGAPGVDLPEPRGHAIEVRINAEDPSRNFAPGPGQITRYVEPGGSGIRVDSGVYQGFVIPGDYDSLVAKLIVHAPDRESAIARLLRGLHEFRIEGVPTTIPLLKSIVDGEEFRKGQMTTDWLDDHLGDLSFGAEVMPEFVASSVESRTVDVEVNGRRYSVRVFDGARQAPAQGRTKPSAKKSAQRGASDGTILSPMHGTVIAIKKVAGESVTAGDSLLVVEAMKMENDIEAPSDGILSDVMVAVGDSIDVNQRLMRLEPIEGAN